MTNRARVVGAAAGAVGLAVAGAALGLRRHSRAIEERDGEFPAFGSLRAESVTVIAEDGVPLHVEVDEPTGDVPGSAAGLTVVFCHGYALNLDSWHFQRSAYRGLVRSVYYDQRSHGHSGRSTEKNATIEQLGRDLAAVIDTVVPEGPVVLIGHSMGGMTILALAEQHPELFGDRVAGVALIATTAGGLDPGRMLFPMLPSKLGGALTGGTVRRLARRHKLVDGVRRAGRSVAVVATDVFAFGDKVPASYVTFVDSMLSATPFDVVAEFFPAVNGIDKFHAVGVLGRVPTMIISGTADKITSPEHGRELHERIPGSTLLECENAGHLVILERHDQVNAALDQLLSAAAEHVGHR